MYREAAKWLEDHELCKTGDWMIDADGNPLSIRDASWAVAACVGGACLVVGGFPSYNIVRPVIAKLFPVEFAASGNYANWNDEFATKEQAVQVLNACADEKGEA